MTPITDAELAELKRLEAAATPGEWETIPRGSGLMGYDVDQVGDEGIGIPNGTRGMFERKEDADSIAALHNAFPALVARIEAAEGLLAEALADAELDYRNDELPSVFGRIKDHLSKKGPAS